MCFSKKEMNLYRTISDTLDIFVHHIAKESAQIPQIGLMNGKMGIAILLYQYGRYRNSSEIFDYADRLIDLVFQEIESGIENSFDKGLYGIIWGLCYLIKQGFVQVDEDVFDQVVTTVLCKESLYIFNGLDVELGKGLCLCNRFITDKYLKNNKWYQQIEKLICRFHDILILKYTTYILPVFPCKILIRFFYVCQKILEHGLFQSEINLLYEELPEIVRVSFKEEKALSEKYILASILDKIPMFDGCAYFNGPPCIKTLKDITNIYLTQLILGEEISVPKMNVKVLSNILKHQMVKKLLNQLNPDNIGLQSNLGGLTWTLLQRCKEQVDICC